MGREGNALAEGGVGEHRDDPSTLTDTGGGEKEKGSGAGRGGQMAGSRGK